MHSLLRIYTQFILIHLPFFPYKNNNIPIIPTILFTTPNPTPTTNYFFLIEYSEIRGLSRFLPQ